MSLTLEQIAKMMLDRRKAILVEWLGSPEGQRFLRASSAYWLLTTWPEPFNPYSLLEDR